MNSKSTAQPMDRWRCAAPTTNGKVVTIEDVANKSQLRRRGRIVAVGEHNEEVLRDWLGEGATHVAEVA